MVKNQCTTERTVKNVGQWIGGLDIECRYGLQQFLEFFSVDRKLERIVWSVLRKAEIIRRKEAERLDARRRRAPLRPLREERRGVSPPEPRPLAPIGICKCGGLLTGEPVPGCETRLTGRVFYKECDSCSYYSEVFKIGDTYKEIEGG